MKALVKAIDAIHSDPEKDRRGCFKKGYPVAVVPDNYLFGSSEGLPNFVIVKCPEATVEEGQPFVGAWYDNFSYIIVSQNAAQGRYTVRVQNDTTSASGLNKITLVRVNSFLTKWGCNNISFTSPYVQFDFRLSTAVQSDGFWDKENIDDFITFTIVSYNSVTGVGRISANVPQNFKKENVLRMIRIRGGIMVSSIHPVYIFDIERSVILEKFKDEAKRKLETKYCSGKYYFTPEQIDTAIAAGGIIMLTKAQLINAIKNKLDE